ncbi:uncharacterized protein EV420DRAFT_1504257 [Desarmillaria tabescens]|uniref:Mediator of RNA polymerase II transcription subunit 20 n=1 Tax=Armillaria tabescens TaxID=1929756 RepID=A0AA39NMK3_ARMTA|nr:uncharacterized protein EV420DRAFT_1504257 [Desarmillaria tabescens]KAK0468396.1 hypothetical protein EV420DRAFT_1504257 [Desarmillaria tabescens]
MGFSGLARWLNAPTTALPLIRENILVNHNGRLEGKWQLSVKSFRSTLSQSDGSQVPSERSMCALTMGENVFRQRNLTSPPTHYRNTFLTLSPPGALEHLLAQLKARWVSVRQSTANTAPRTQAAGPQLLIDGHVFSIGTDWIVRIGNVLLSGGAVKGMLLEAEYLPLPVLRSPLQDGTSELLSNLLTSILPNIRDAKTVAITISDSQWEDVLWNREEEEKKGKQSKEERVPVDDEDDIYVYGDEEEEGKRQPRDWTGVDRDRRSAFLIMGALRSEGIL